MYEISSYAFGSTMRCFVFCRRYEDKVGGSSLYLSFALFKHSLVDCCNSLCILNFLSKIEMILFQLSC